MLHLHTVYRCLLIGRQPIVAQTSSGQRITWRAHQAEVGGQRVRTKALLVSGESPVWHWLSPSHMPSSYAWSYYVTGSVQQIVRAGLASCLAVAMLSACDDRPPSAATELPTETSARVNIPESLPSDTPTSTPVPTLVPEPTATPPSSMSNPTPTQAPTSTPASELTPPPGLLFTVSSIPKGLPSYDRDDWRHWTDEDDDCQNTRHEVLIAESQAAVTYKSDRQCQVDGGQWFGAFTATTVKEASKLDIDHLVPLANAHQSGGWTWTDEKKEQYANSLDHPDHLIAVTAGANRSKGAKGPDEWRPPTNPTGASTPSPGLG